MAGTKLSYNEPVQVRDVEHFLDKKEGFLGTAKHFHVKYQSGKGSYKHHFLVNTERVRYEQSGRTEMSVEIIHFSGISGKTKHEILRDQFFLPLDNDSSDRQSNEGGLCRRLHDGEWHLVTPSGLKIEEEDAEKAWAFAEKFVGKKEEKYNLILNNCEHFVTKVLYGEKYCSQVEKIMEKCPGLGPALVRTAGAVLESGAASKRKLASPHGKSSRVKRSKES